MLGVGDFYYELGVQIIEVCLALKHRNGGLYAEWLWIVPPKKLFSSASVENIIRSKKYLKENF